MPDAPIDKIDYAMILEKYPWLTQPDQKCVISPDADGMLCGLFMSHFLGWEIVGYYDNGKNLILKNGVHAKDCIFLDTEIYRPEIRSIGHHISLFRKDSTGINMANYANCLNPNNLRGRTLKENFSLKYPMGTIHLLISIIGSTRKIDFSDESFFTVLQADGTINRFLDRYSDNLRSWLVYLGIEDDGNVFAKMLSKETTLLKINKEYVDYIQRFVKNKHDKIPISEKGLIKDLSFARGRTSFSDDCIRSTVEYLEFLSENTGWGLDKHKWVFNDFCLFEFTKRTVKPGVRTFNTAVQENFLSLAITANDTMEYTLEEPAKLP